MALVAYSDSESSDIDIQPKAAVKTTPQPIQSQTVAGFAVNKSNPRKIQVNLENSTTSLARDETGEPALKRAKIGNDGPRGFNAMLPAPKREVERKSTSNGTARKAFSLKTGAEPGFSREADAELRQLFAEQTSTLPSNGAGNIIAKEEGTATSEPLKAGTPMRFRPLSVARNTKKRPNSAQSQKIATPGGQKVSQAPTPASATSVPAPKPKISLFSAATENSPVVPGDDEYNEPEPDEGAGQQDEGNVEIYSFPIDKHREGSLVVPPQSQSLDTIASDLNLSATDRRRLFGREGKGSSSAINIVNFNTDQEYAANEALRASGEQVQHQAVRGIAPGKHSLKQLVNAATTQKDALEESFAAGKSNKKEAGGRYGW